MRRGHPHRWSTRGPPEVATHLHSSCTGRGGSCADPSIRTYIHLGMHVYVHACTHPCIVSCGGTSASSILTQGPRGPSSSFDASAECPAKCLEKLTNSWPCQLTLGDDRQCQSMASCGESRLRVCDVGQSRILELVGLCRDELWTCKLGRSTSEAQDRHEVKTAA